MYFGFCGIVVAIAIIFITLALDEISEKETVETKTINLTDGLVHITIPSFEEWCNQNSISDISVASVPSALETDIPTTTKTETIDFLSLLTSYGIAKTRANILLNTFGENLLIIAKERGVKELTKVKGIGDATAKKVIAIVNDLDDWANNDGVVSPII